MKYEKLKKKNLSYNDLCIDLFNYLY